MTKTRYIGRFAPSPTGPLHLGSLFTALASFLEARSKQGLWILRIDDLDTARNIPGASDAILRTLEAFGLHWDQHESYQSQHLAAYSEALRQLTEQNLVYPCSCSRKILAEYGNGEAESIYPQFCRSKNTLTSSKTALRIKTEASSISFHDQLQGLITQNLVRQHGDFIIKRKDQIIAYQLAVVIDDQLQNINHVVRGADLLNSCIKQIYLHQCLNIAPPNYLHVPLITGINGHKLSKKDFAPAVTKQNSHLTLYNLLKLLNQNPPPELQQSSAESILTWAIANWNLHNLQRIRSIAL